MYNIEANEHNLKSYSRKAMSISFEDFESVCRCCLVKVGSMKSIFENCLDGMLIELIQTQIKENDGLPQQICRRCILKLSTAHTFYLAVKRNHNTLQEIFKEATLNGTISLPVKEKLVVKDNQELETVTGQKDLTPTVEEKLPESQHVEQSREDPEVETERYSESEDWYPCPRCKHYTKSYEDLQVHLQTHEVSSHDIKGEKDTKRLLCNYCGKRFRWRTSLCKHMRLHRGAVYQCKYCDKRYTEASTLKIHLVSHNLLNTKPFHCAVCDRAFTQRSSLNKHERVVHAPARENYQCVDCGRNFLQKRTLRKHIARIHTASPCALCNTEFTGQKALDVHMRIHTTNSIQLNTGNEMIQETSGHIFTDPVSIQTVTVEFLCLLCTQKFQTKESMEVHVCSSQQITL